MSFILKPQKWGGLGPPGLSSLERNLWIIWKPTAKLLGFSVQNLGTAVVVCNGVVMLSLCLFALILPICMTKEWFLMLIFTSVLIMKGVGLRPLSFRDCGFESRRGLGCLSLVNVVCCQVGVSALGLSLVQRSPTACCLSECDREASIMRRP